MTWTGRVSFVLTANMALKKIAFLEAPLLKKRGEDDPFDANGAIVTGELAQLIPDLIEAFGGEREFDGEPAEEEGSTAAAGEYHEGELEEA